MMAAVIVHFGRSDLTLKLVGSIDNSTIIVVLHSAMEAELPERIIVLEEPNKGFAAGLNLAARHLQKNHPEIDTVLALNPDIEPEPGALDRLLETHMREKADVTFPAIREGALLLQGYELGAFGTLRRVAKGSHLFPGTCFLFSMNAWQKAGGFNEEYFHYFEDLEFCEKLFRMKGKIFYAGDIVVNHIGKSGVAYPATRPPEVCRPKSSSFHPEIRKDESDHFLECLPASSSLPVSLAPPAGAESRNGNAGIREFRSLKA